MDVQHIDTMHTKFACMILSLAIIKAAYLHDADVENMSIRKQHQSPRVIHIQDQSWPLTEDCLHLMAVEVHTVDPEVDHPRAASGAMGFLQVWVGIGMEVAAEKVSQGVGSTDQIGT